MLAATSGARLGIGQKGKSRQDQAAAGMRADFHKLRHLGIDQGKGLGQAVEQLGARGLIADAVDDRQCLAAEGRIGHVLLQPGGNLGLDVRNLRRMPGRGLADHADRAAEPTRRSRGGGAEQAGERELQIANCKLQIANCGQESCRSIIGKMAHALLLPSSRVRVAFRRRIQSQSQISNLQFAICHFAIAFSSTHSFFPNSKSRVTL